MIICSKRINHFWALIMSRSSLSEQELLDACIAGDKKAWDTFVERYTNLIYHTTRRVFDRHYVNYLYNELEDIHNSIFLLFMENNYKKLRQYQGLNGCSVSGWIVTVATNFTLNSLRDRKDLLSLDSSPGEDEDSLIDTIPDAKPSTLDVLTESEQYELLHELIKTLNVKEKLFLKYFYEDDLPPEEIASVMSVSVSTVYSTKSRIIEKLKNLAKKKDLLQENR